MSPSPPPQSTMKSYKSDPKGRPADGTIVGMTGGLSRPHPIPQVNSQPQSSQATLILVQQEHTLVNPVNGSHPTTESLSGVGVGVIGSGHGQVTCSSY